MKANKKLFLMLMIQGIITTSLILLFLSGKITDYPRGTQEGGMTLAIGVVLINMVSFGVTFYLILKHSEEGEKLRR